MTENWEKILTTALPYQAELAKAKLLENGIEAVIMNTQSSAYPVLDGLPHPAFGEVSVLVMKTDVLTAHLLLADDDTVS
jgi:Putative prokaryotic signal transducing protein